LRPDFSDYQLTPRGALSHPMVAKRT
jgi:hypothetical protein